MMNSKVKLSVSIIALLLIGFLGGFMVHKHLMNERLQGIKKMNRSEFLADKIIDIVQADEGQSIDIRRIVLNDMNEIRNKRKRHLKSNRIKMVEMFEKVKNQLDTNQVERLERMQRRMMERRRGSHKNKDSRPPRE
jgi:hypothetical protein